MRLRVNIDRTAWPAHRPKAGSLAGQAVVSISNLNLTWKRSLRGRGTSQKSDSKNFIGIANITSVFVKYHHENLTSSTRFFHQISGLQGKPFLFINHSYFLIDLLDNYNHSLFDVLIFAMALCFWRIHNIPCLENLTCLCRLKYIHNSYTIQVLRRFIRYWITTVMYLYVLSYFTLENSKPYLPEL